MASTTRKESKPEVPACERFFSNCDAMLKAFMRDFPEYSSSVSSIVPFLGLVPKRMPIDAFIALCSDEIFEAVLHRKEDEILKMAEKLSKSDKLDGIMGGELIKKIFGDLLATIKNILLAEKSGQLSIDGAVRNFYYMVAGGLVKISAKEILANPDKYDLGDSSKKAHKYTKEYLLSITQPTRT